ncbi:MAG: hypothetical protein KC996_10510, partial [Phycisphaerales bacterium]|nr:hypothetical protein [Phycisphaerales bacterium]
ASKNLKAKQKKLIAAQSRLRTVWTLAGALLVLLSLGGVSWVIAGQVRPGTYAANVVIVPASNRKLTTGELRAWQEFHEDLLMDPQFMEIACERLKRRGITTLATPGMLLEYLETNLSFQSPAPGRLEVEIRGDGPTRTERILDTYAVTLAGEANRARVSRSDGAGTQLESPAKAQRLPLDNQRLATSGVIFAASGGLFLFFGTFGYARLVRVKNEFEKRGELDMILDEANWVDPRTL